MLSKEERTGRLNDIKGLLLNAVYYCSLAKLRLSATASEDKSLKICGKLADVVFNASDDLKFTIREIKKLNEVKDNGQEKESGYNRDGRGVPAGKQRVNGSGENGKRGERS